MLILVLLDRKPISKTTPGSSKSFVYVHFEFRNRLFATDFSSQKCIFESKKGARCAGATTERNTMIAFQTISSKWATNNRVQANETFCRCPPRVRVAVSVACCKCFVHFRLALCFLVNTSNAPAHAWTCVPLRWSSTLMNLTSAPGASSTPGAKRLQVAASPGCDAQRTMSGIGMRSRFSHGERGVRRSCTIVCSNKWRDACLSRYD